MSNPDPFSPRVRWIRWMLLALLAAAGPLLTGCTTPLTPPSRYVLRDVQPTAPPPGKALIQIHRPRARQGYNLYTGVYDSMNLVADLGNGHSVAYVCDPGTHYMINRSIERVGVVEVRALAGRTYHLRLDTAGAFLASFQLEPVRKNDKLARRIPAWTKDHIWVTRGPAAPGHEESARIELETILRDFVNGAKKGRIRHLGPEDSW